MIYRTTIGILEARIATEVIERELKLRSKAAVMAVADAHGELIVLIRMDEAPLPSILIAANKAWTAARERKETRVIGQAARDPIDGFDMGYFGDSRYVGWGGGVPVVHKNRLVGSVGVSGLPEKEDMELARMGVEAVIEYCDRNL